MVRRRVVALALLGAVLAANCALADDYNPPSWRGQENTTFQQWEFSTEAALAPDMVDNAGGTPTLQVAGPFPFTAWLNEDLGHQGVWKFEDFIEIYIPNIIDEEPLKEIWIQLTYQADSIGQGLAPLFLTDPSLSGSALLVDQHALGDGYFHETYSIIIEPNPDFETIWIQPRNCTFYLDEIVIDTISRVPEPTTICLLGFGVLGLLRKRK